MSLSRHHDFSSSIYGQANSERRLRTRRSSISNSDDGQGGYDAVKHDDIDSGEDHSLTSQTLNADGTPKRPMNAFMIFARRRRPQVSAENQSLRTGEVSKLLSKEWSSMPASEKQFYQEQAKLLKDSFNSKYPDYVYRRRPNNSRRRPRPNAGGKGSDGDLMGDLGDEPASPSGFDSPEGDEHFDVGSDYSYARPSQDGSLLRDPSSLKYGQRTTLPPVPNQMPFRQGSGNESRMPLGSPQDRLSQNMGPPLQPRIPTSSQPASGIYGQMSPPSGPEFNSHGPWNGRPSRGTAPMWSEGLQQDRNAGGYKLDLKPVSIGASENWSHSPTSSNDSSNSPHNLFSSLTAPYNGHSNQTGMHTYKTSTSSTAQYPQPSSTNLASNRAFDPRGTSVLGMNEPLVYPARTMNRELPPVHTIPGYSSQSPSSVGQLGSPQVYPWPPRDFYGNGRGDFDLMGISGLKDQ